MKLAVALHLFNMRLIDEFADYISNIGRAGYKYDMYIAVPANYHKYKVASRWPTAKIVVVEDRGFDIASFFTMVSTTALGKNKYDYVLKIHSKSNKVWRKELLDPILSSPQQVKHAIGLLEGNKDIGMVGSKKWCLSMGQDWGKHQPHVLDISEQWGIEHGECKFIGGTIFWVRWSLLREAFEKQNLPAIIRTCNTCSTLDWHWYLLHYPDLPAAGIDTKEKALLHWEKHGKKEGRACNVLYGRKNRIPTRTDGMLEHAYERWFGMLAGRVEGI